MHSCNTTMSKNDDVLSKEKDRYVCSCNDGKGSGEGYRLFWLLSTCVSHDTRDKIENWIFNDRITDDNRSGSTMISPIYIRWGKIKMCCRKEWIYNDTSRRFPKMKMSYHIWLYVSRKWSGIAKWEERWC